MFHQPKKHTKKTQHKNCKSQWTKDRDMQKLNEVVLQLYVIVDPKN